MGDRGLATRLCRLSLGDLFVSSTYTDTYKRTFMTRWDLRLETAFLSGTAALHCPLSAIQLTIACFIAGQGLDTSFPFA